MKYAYIFYLVSVFLIQSFEQEKVDDKILKVMSFNIRCGSCEDTSDVNHWNKRKFRIFQLLNKYEPDIIGFQEAELWQLTDIGNEFNDYLWLGKARDDGKEKGEFTAVFYKEKRFHAWDNYTYWLSETPDEPSNGWDAALNRTLTVAMFYDYMNERIVCFFNTHFDHVGNIARTESAKFLREIVTEYSGKYPAVITGDFNFTEDSDGYDIITSAEFKVENPIDDFQYKPLVNSKYISEKPHTGGDTTFNAFGKGMELKSAIDFIFVNDKVKVLTHQTIIDVPEGLFPSDHYPVLVELLFKGSK
jgi:endonuclease/exonuclease/phosphatase family metal-dependent hydrolase